MRKVVGCIRTRRQELCRLGLTACRRAAAGLAVVAGADSRCPVLPRITPTEPGADGWDPVASRRRRITDIALLTRWCHCLSCRWHSARPFPILRRGGLPCKVALAAGTAAWRSQTMSLPLPARPKASATAYMPMPTLRRLETEHDTIRVACVHGRRDGDSVPSSGSICADKSAAAMKSSYVHPIDDDQVLAIPQSRCVGIPQQLPRRFRNPSSFEAEAHIDYDLKDPRLKGGGFGPALRD